VVPASTNRCQTKWLKRTRSAAKNATPAVYASPPAASHSRPGRGTRSHRGRTAIRISHPMPR
jgi:hypothetical protein